MTENMRKNMNVEETNELKPEDFERKEKLEYTKVFTNSELLTKLPSVMRLESCFYFFQYQYTIMSNSFVNFFNNLNYCHYIKTTDTTDANIDKNDKIIKYHID